MLSRGASASDFGMNSMFESTRQRKNLADEDAPPTNSVNDIPNEVGFNPSPHFRGSTRNSADEVPLFARRPQRAVASTTSQQPTQQQPIYIVVFGYPPEKYSSTVEFFQSLGATTDPDPHLEIQNCFRIGFTDPGDAVRAMRKNGEVLGGSWMVGVKWADPAQAEAILSQVKPQAAAQVPESSSNNDMAVDEPAATTTPASPQKGTTAGSKGSGGGIFSTPTKLAPASAAFRKRNPDAVATPQPQRPWGLINHDSSAQFQQQQQPLQHAQTQAPPQTNSPNKGMLGQVSDLIFGW
ncbi:hypothetical protein H0H87_003387 [Tephrocybe sp. NHM501043]|nr:hypothetical protein H0H87_003387 [Tephrocybe sp. NHM501043]